MKMSPGIIKYGLYLLIGAWMFVLGVVVGRGTSPVTFDTVSFQERLKVIVGKVPEQAPATEKVDLDFYEALNKPVPQDTGLAVPPIQKNLSQGEVAAAPVEPDEDGVPVKLSRKRATFSGGAQASVSGKEARAETAAAKSPPAKAVAQTTAAAARKPEADSPASDGSASDASVSDTPASENGAKYTIQVAAYKAFKDAVTQMSQLEKKGFSSYRTKGEANGTIWYRVRTGAFKDFASAQDELNRLKQAKINGMIIKKDDQ